MKALEALTNVIVLRRNIPDVDWAGRLPWPTPRKLALIWVGFNPWREGKIPASSSGLRQGCGCISTSQLCKAPTWSYGEKG